MNLPKKSILPCFLYGIPYIILIYLLTYYFDFIERAYPPFLPAILLILVLFPIYIGLGCLCGRENRDTTLPLIPFLLAAYLLFRRKQHRIGLIK